MTEIRCKCCNKLLVKIVNSAIYKANKEPIEFSLLDGNCKAGSTIEIKCPRCREINEIAV